MIQTQAATETKATIETETPKVETQPTATKTTYASGAASPAAKKVLAETLRQRAYKEKSIVDVAQKTADAIKELEKYNRKAVFCHLKEYDCASKEHSYVEITEWKNGEGIDMLLPSPEVINCT